MLIATVGRSPDAGYWGEVMTHASLARGLRGLVIDGCVRDAEPIEGLGFPVFARGLCVRGTTKKGPSGSMNGTIRLGSVTVRPGDLVVGDRDGVVVLPKAEAASILARARERVRREARMIQALRGGARTLDLLGVEVRSHRRSTRPVR